MRSNRAIRKIGSWVSVLGVLTILNAGARADDVEFSAQLDRDQISIDESVSVKFSVEAGGDTRIGEIRFDAPDFEVINEYNSVYTKSLYVNGRFETKNSHQVTKVLKPLRTGSLTISKIHLLANAKTYTAGDLRVQVKPAGSTAPPPRGYGGGGLGLRGSGKQVSGASAFVRAEVNRDQLYKGEQVIVTYYLYSRVNIIQIQADKFPEMKGFLREELELPIASQRREREQVVVDGVPYLRMPLAKYAAYPLEEGKLKLDPMVVQFQYLGRDAPSEADDDIFQNFFRQAAPRIASSRSETLVLDVKPLPTDGRPPAFSGGVGQFTLNSAVDRYQVHANEAVTLTIKVEGRGNMAAVQEPRAKWSDQLELYDSKGRSKSGAGGVGEKVFEFLLIPRSPGKVTLPRIEMSFFDPEKKAYVTQTTDPIVLDVLDPLPGSALAPMPSRGTQVGDPKDPQDPQLELKGLKPFNSITDSTEGRFFPWRWMYGLGIFGVVTFLGLIGFDLIGKRMIGVPKILKDRRGKGIKSWDRLKQVSAGATAGAAWKEVTQAYETLSGLVFDALDRKYGVGARSYSRGELKNRLVSDEGLGEAEWNRISRLLEYAEMVRFAASAGAVSERNAREELAKWVEEGERVVGLLADASPKT